VTDFLSVSERSIEMLLYWFNTSQQKDGTFEKEQIKSERGNNFLEWQLFSEFRCSGGFRR